MKKKTIFIILGIFALVIVTTAASFAFFTYSRVGNTTTTITSGDIEFTYKEGDNASLANAFPVADSVGANDTSEEYTFTVNLKSSSASNKMNYNVYLLDANDDENTNYFNNEQIKFALIKDGTFVAGTSATEGKKLSSIPGFAQGMSEGEGLVLESQEITAGKTDEYKLRIWISDDVNYSNTDRVDDNTDEFNDSQTSIGKYNGYKYSLKVKVTSGVINYQTFNDFAVTNKTISVELNDPSGLSAYAVTTSDSAPVDDSSEWITVSTTDSTAKSGVVRMNDTLITSKKITYTVENDGIYYLHVKNTLNEKTKKKFVIGAGSEQTITFNSDGEILTNLTKVIKYEDTYGNLPIPTRQGYTFVGWFTGLDSDVEVTSESKYTDLFVNTLYAKWEINGYKLTINPNGGTYNGSTEVQEMILQQGEELKLDTLIKDGYMLFDVEVTGNGSTYLLDGTFKMGDEDTTVLAKWGYEPTVSCSREGATMTGGLCYYECGTVDGFTEMCSEGVSYTCPNGGTTKYKRGTWCVLD